MKKRSILIISGVILFFLFVLLIVGSRLYVTGLLPVDKNDKENVEFVITSGTPTTQIIGNLKKVDLIRNEISLKIYAKLHTGVPMAGRYILNKSMSATEIYDKIINGKITNDTVWVQFIEGKRLSYIESVIAKNFEFTESEIDAVLEDETFIKRMIEKYDVLTDDVLNSKIYHPLEGYLFCDTYEFPKDITIEGIIEKMIATLDAKVSKYENEIDASKYDIHELMTLASIVEMEGARSNDRRGVAGVFYNRLSSGWTLGSDVTTYYAVGKDFSVDLTWSDLNSCNGYNTRGSCVSGLPVGPIASFSSDSLDAVMNPTKHDYYYFVADKNGKTYFSKTDYEHQSTIRRLQSEGLWFTY